MIECKKSNSFKLLTVFWVFLGIIVIFFGVFFLINQNAKCRSLAEIKKSGVLKVLMMKRPEVQGLQRRFSSDDLEFAMLSAFAEEQQLKLEVIRIADFADLFQALKQGRGDIASDNLTITANRQKELLFTLPYTDDKELLITNLNSGLTFENPGKNTIGFMAGTSHIKRLKDLQNANSELKIQAFHCDAEELISLVGAGKLKLAIVDENNLNSYKSYRNDVKIIKNFPELQPIGWALPNDANELKSALDKFIENNRDSFNYSNFTSDLSDIKKRRTLRVITRDNPLNYYIHKNELYGFEYELSKKFAEANNLNLVMVTTENWEDLISYLQSGKGDIIASSMSVTSGRLKSDNVIFCRPYVKVNEVVFGRKSNRPPRNLKELNPHTFAVRRASSYYDTLRNLQKKGFKFKIAAVEPELESFEILTGVACGIYDYTLVDNLIGKLFAADNPEVESSLVLSSGKQYAWMVRKDNPELKKAVDDFFQRELTGDFYKRLYRKYFQSFNLFYEPELENLKNQISDYDYLIKKYAEKHNFDWEFIAAQVCQESRFKPEITAPDGGMGLLQLMPATALEMNCFKPYDPESNLRAGVGYLAKLKQRFGSGIDDFNKNCFALAAYNGGFGHIIDARKLASELGKNPNIWFNHVETAMKMLSEKRYYSRARYGFCRSDIIVRYVRQITERSKKYRQLVR